jgi:hypothetical protein
LINPDQLFITGIEDYYVLCEGGTFHLEPNETWTTYSWTGPEGFESDQASVDVTLAGEYNLLVTDELNCEAETGTLLEVSENALEADFIRISESFLYEPIVLVDLSVPVPDRIEWMIPEDRGIAINDQDEISIELIFTELGDFEIGVRSFLSNCESTAYKTISIVESEGEASEGGRESSLNVNVEIYPNPARDHLNLVVSAETRDPVLVELKDLQGNTFLSENLDGRLDYLVSWQIPDLTSGVYVLTIQSSKSVSSKRILVVK